MADIELSDDKCTIKEWLAINVYTSALGVLVVNNVDESINMNLEGNVMVI
jgi:hypothetical protein